MRELEEFLREKKRQGYVIVGVEQTSTSVSLESFLFPEKCVVVLGKEREGIPADILQLVDVCVEIPQFGVTRSLNVHVSGSLVLWEMKRQQLVCKSLSQ